MKKIDAVMRALHDEKKAKADRKEKAAKIQRDIVSLERTKTAALEAGDKTAYKKAAADIEDLRLDMAILNNADKKQAVTPDKIDEAWREFSSTHEEELSNKLAKVDQAREALKDATEAVFRHENEGLKLREELAGLIGETDLGRFQLANIPNESRPFNPGAIHNPEACYLISCDRWPRATLAGKPDALTDAYSIIVTGRSVERFQFDD